MKDPRDVIIEPIVSEKSYALLDQNVYTFLVHPDATQARDRATPCARSSTSGWSR